MNELTNKEKEEFVFLFFLFVAKNEKNALFNSFLFFKFLKTNNLETIYSPIFLSKTEIYSIHFDNFLKKISFCQFFLQDLSFSQNGLARFEVLKNTYPHLYFLLSSFQLSADFERDVKVTCALYTKELLNCSVCEDMTCDENSLVKIMKNSTLFHRKNPYKSF